MLGFDPDNLGTDRPQIGRNIAEQRHDPWRGDVTVKKQGEKLRMVFSRTTDMQGDLQAMKGNVFAVRWDDRTLKADALVNFRTGMDGAVSGMTMAPLSPTTDFSFDYQDLDFSRSAPATANP